MIDAFSTPHNKIRSFILLVICGLFAIAARVVGIDDNLPGILLAFLAATAFVLAFVHPWRTSTQFIRLLYGSVLSFVVFGILHNLFEAFASNFENSSLVSELLNIAGATLFLIATLVCPPAFLIGALGAVIMSIRNRRQSTPGSKTAA